MGDRNVTTSDDLCMLCGLRKRMLIVPTNCDKVQTTMSRPLKGTTSRTITNIIITAKPIASALQFLPPKLQRES